MLRIFGDIDLSDGYFDRGIGVGAKLKRGQNPFEAIPRDKDDFWIGNFECVCSNEKETGVPFIINPEHFQDFPHLNLYGVANNHVMQHGDFAYSEMLNYFDSKNILYAGTHNRRSVKFYHQRKKVGLLAFSQRPDNFTDAPLYWHLPEMSDIEGEISKISDCDYKIAFLHWGYEFINYPNVEQKQLAHWMVDKGIDIVVGMHPHVMQGYEIYKGKYIFYSLGNCVFNMPWDPTKYGLTLKIDLSAEPRVEYEYILLESYFPRIVNDVPEKYSVEYLNSLLKINEDNEKYFAKAYKSYLEYRKVNRRDILCNFMKIGPKASCQIIKNFFKK